MRLPQFTCDLQWFDPVAAPPGLLIARLVRLVVVHRAERDRELIAHFAAHGPVPLTIVPRKQFVDPIELILGLFAFSNEGVLSMLKYCDAVRNRLSKYSASINYLALASQSPLTQFFDVFFPTGRLRDFRVRRGRHFGSGITCDVGPVRSTCSVIWCELPGPLGSVKSAFPSAGLFGTTPSPIFPREQNWPKVTLKANSLRQKKPHTAKCSRVVKKVTEVGDRIG